MKAGLCETLFAHKTVCFAPLSRPVTLSDISRGHVWPEFDELTLHILLLNDTHIWWNMKTILCWVEPQRRPLTVSLLQIFYYCSLTILCERSMSYPLRVNDKKVTMYAKEPFWVSKSPIYILDESGRIVHRMYCVNQRPHQHLLSYSCSELTFHVWKR